GYDQPVRIGASASDLASPLFGWWLAALGEGFEAPAAFPGPVLPRRGLCTVTGRVPGPACKVVAAPFLPGTGPAGVCQDPHELPADAGEDSEVVPAHGRESLWKRLAREREAAVQP